MARSTFLGNVRSSVTNLLGGVRGFQNLGAWALAGTVAYFLWVKPELDLQREQEARLALARENDPYRHVERIRPSSQDGGVTYGKAKDTNERL